VADDEEQTLLAMQCFIGKVCLQLSIRLCEVEPPTRAPNAVGVG